MDAREQILQRLLVIAKTIPGIKKVYRNRLRPPEANLPAILVIDGDDKADENDKPTRGPMSPRRMVMYPQILFVLPEDADAEQVGTDLNALRGKMINKVATDQPLIDLTTNRMGAFLHSDQTSLAWGRSMLGEMGVSFGIPYVMDPKTVDA